MAQGYTVQVQGLFNNNDAVRLVGVTAMTLSGDTLSVTMNSGSTTVNLATATSVRLFKGVTEFPQYGNTYTASGSGANTGHTI